MAPKPILPILDMEHRHVGLTKAIADSNMQAAVVCLDRHHESPVDFDLDRNGSRTVAGVAWQASDAQTRAAWANEIDATEAGAYQPVEEVCSLSPAVQAAWR